MAKGIRGLSAVEKDIPLHLCRTVGVIITKWSYLEYHLSLIVWKLMQVDDVLGRFAVRYPRAKEKLYLIRMLLSLKDKELPDKDYNALFKMLDTLQDRRDVVAHGLWTKKSGDWGVIRTRGKSPEPHPSIAQRKREASSPRH